MCVQKDSGKEGEHLFRQPSYQSAEETSNLGRVDKTFVHKHKSYDSSNEKK